MDNFQVIALPSQNSRKSMSAFFVYQILLRTCREHPMTQAQILTALEEEYGVRLARQALGRTINVLVNEDIGFFKSAKGCWYEKVSWWAA